MRKLMLLTSILIITLAVCLITPKSNPSVKAAGDEAALLIDTPEKLLDFANLVNDYQSPNKFTGQTVVLANDIDAGTIRSDLWTPIGTGFGEFNGTFDGQDFVITNLNPTAGNTFLFDKLDANAQITNLNITGTAALCKQAADKSKFTNCYDAAMRDEVYASVEAALAGDKTLDRATITTQELARAHVQTLISGTAAEIKNKSFSLPTDGTATIDGFLGTPGEYTFEAVAGISKTPAAVYTFTIAAEPFVGTVNVKIDTKPASDNIEVGGTFDRFSATATYVGQDLALITEPYVTWSLASGDKDMLTLNQQTQITAAGVLMIYEFERAKSVIVTATHGGLTDKVEIFIARLAQEVKPAAAPKIAGTDKAVTHTSITLIAMEDITVDEGGEPFKIEYGISKTDNPADAAWQAGIYFVGLEPDTQYYIFARTARTDVYLPSEASPALEVKTAAAPANDSEFEGPELWRDYTGLVIGLSVGGAVVVLVAAGGACAWLVLLRKRKIHKTK